MNQRGFSLKKCMVGLVLAIAMVIQTPVSGFAADVCTQSNVVQAEGKVSKTRVNNVNAYYLGIPENVRQYLEDKGWTFICSAQSFGKRYGYTGSILANPQSYTKSDMLLIILTGLRQIRRRLMIYSL